MGSDAINFKTREANQSRFKCETEFQSCSEIDSPEQSADHVTWKLCKFYFAADFADFWSFKKIKIH